MNSLHIHNRSDAVSGFYGQEKKVYVKDRHAQEAYIILKDVGKTLPVTHEGLQQMSTFTIIHIYNDKISKTLGEARTLKWSQMKGKSTSYIPPDLHVRRAKC